MEAVSDSMAVCHADTHRTQHTTHTTSTHKKQGQLFTFLFGVLRNILLPSLPVLLDDASWHLALCDDVMGDCVTMLMKVYLGHGGR